MIALLRGELLKTLTTRSLYAFLGGAMAFSLLNVFIVAAASGDLDEVSEKKEALVCLPVLLLVWGLAGVAGEYRHRTAAPAALVARRSRASLLLARLTAYAVVGFVMSTLVMGVTLAVGLPMLSAHPGPDLGAGDVRAVLVANVVGGTLCAFLGAAIGALVRNQVLGAVLVLVTDFAVIPLAAGWDERLTNLTSFGAAAVLSGMSHNTTITQTTAAFVLAAWTGVVAAAAMVSEQRRDVA